MAILPCLGVAVALTGCLDRSDPFGIGCELFFSSDRGATGGHDLYHARVVP